MAVASVMSVVVSTIVVIAMILMIMSIACIMGAVFTAITGCIFIRVPGIRDEIDWTSAGVVLAAIPFPILAMAWWHAQIDRLTSHHFTLDDDRLRINHSGLRIIANINLTVKTGLADVDRDAHARK